MCARSIEDNVYYSPQYAQALLHNVERDTSVRFAVVWEGARLVGLLPFTAPKLSIPLLGPSGRAWQTKYTFSCTPLLEKSRPCDAAAALLDVLASVSEGEWIIPAVNTQGGACQAMIQAFERTGQPWLFSNQFQRATLAAGASVDEHMQSQVSSKRRKDLARNRRRLEELGKVAHESHRFGEGLQRAVLAFLKIEASGWKGKRGTALACNEKTRQFAIDAFTGAAANSICRADMLTLDGVPIAVSLIVFAGGTGFAVKCTYDETYRSYSVGLLLEVEVIRSFLSERWASRLDAATAGAHVIDSLWSGRIEVADLIFSLSPRYPERRLAVFQHAEKVKTNFKGAIKRSLTRLRSG